MSPRRRLHIRLEMTKGKTSWKSLEWCLGRNPTDMQMLDLLGEDNCSYSDPRLFLVASRFVRANVPQQRY
jgi:hypothetical protein